MKHSYEIIILLAAGSLLFSSCSKKATFFFSDGAGSFGPTLKTAKIKVLADSLATLQPKTAPDDSNQAYSEVFTAAISSETNTTYEPNPKKAIPNYTLSGEPPLKPETQLTSPGKRTLLQLKAAGKKIKIPAEEIKTVNKKAAHGMLLSLGALVAFFITVGAQIPFLLIPGAVAAFTGTIMSLVGLGQIHKNPDAYTGKGKGLTGLLVGLLMSAVYLVILAAILAL